MELSTALEGVGRTAPDGAKIAVLQNLAEECVENLEESRRERAAAEKRKSDAGSDLKKREAALKRETEALAVWQGDFEEALKDTWIQADSTPDQVGAILNRLPELSEARANLQTAKHRLDQMAQDAA